MASLLTPEERQGVRALVRQLAERHPRGWEGLMFDAEVPMTTAQAWRYGKEPGTPSAVNLLKLLRAGGILNESFQLPTVQEALQAAQQAAEAGGAAAERAEQRARDGQGQGESK